MKTFTDQQVVNAAMLIIGNTKDNLADGKITLGEKNGAVAAIVAIMMLLGIPVVFEPDPPKNIN